MSETANKTIFSDDQRRHFVDQGYVVARGLLPAELVASSRAAMCRAMELDPEDASTWPGKYSMANLEQQLLTHVLRTEDVEAAAEELVGPHFLRGECFSPYLEKLGLAGTVSTNGYIPVFNFPVQGPREFVPPQGWHLDGLHVVSTWPEKLYLVIFAYLTDVTEYGGATAVLPGSHRQIFEHCMRTGEAAASRPPDLEYAAPVPFVGQAGDVVFMHYLLAHSGTANRSDQIRMGLNSGIQPDPARPYQRREGAPDASWTPMDFTLRTDNI